MAEEAEEEVEEAAEEGDAAGDFKSNRSTLENNGQQGNQLDENYRTPTRKRIHQAKDRHSEI